MITNILLFALANSIAILGLHSVFSGDSWLAKGIQKITPKVIENPVYGCPVCMSSIWGVVGFVIGHTLLIGSNIYVLTLDSLIVDLPVHLILTAGIVTIYTDWLTKDIDADE